MSTPDDSNPFDPPLELDADALHAAKIAAAQRLIPGLKVLPGQALNHLLGLSAETDAETREAFSALMAEQMTSLLGDLHEIPRLTGSPATSSITVTANNTAGHVLPDGRGLSVDGIEVETVGTLVIPAGQTTGSIPIQTVEATAAHNGATADPVDLELQQTESWIAEAGVSLDAPLADGVDPEDASAYGRRLRDELEILAGKPTFPRDFAIVARRHPAVGVAWVLNLYDPDTGQTNVPRMVTVVVADPLGEPLSAPTMAEIRALYDNPLLNLDVRVIAPSYQTIPVTGTVLPRPGVPDATAEDTAAAQLTEALSPGRWVWMSQLSVVDNPVPNRTVHAHQLVAIARQSEAVDYLPTLTIGDGTSDAIVLAGPTTLPRPGTITITAATP